MTGKSVGPIAGILAAVAAAGVIAGCSSSGSSSASAAGLTVSTRVVSGVGTVLTSASGRTLYSPEQEASGTIKCTGSCLGFWFPVTMAKGTTPHADSSLTGKLGSIQRPDNGESQLTDDGKPLYTFRLDTGPGQAHGNNYTDSFGGQTFLWHAATASGAAPATGQPSSAPGYGSGGGGGY